MLRRGQGANSLKKSLVMPVMQEEEEGGGGGGGGGEGGGGVGFTA